MVYIIHIFIVDDNDKNNLFLHMIQQNNIDRYVSRINGIIVKEIALGHKFRWHATNYQTIVLFTKYVVQN